MKLVKAGNELNRELGDDASAQAQDIYEQGIDLDPPARDGQK